MSHRIVNTERKGDIVCPKCKAPRGIKTALQIDDSIEVSFQCSACTFFRYKTVRANGRTAKDIIGDEEIFLPDTYNERWTYSHEKSTESPPLPLTIIRKAKENAQPLP